MTIELGTTDINGIQLGSTEINKIMLGSDEIYSAGASETNNPNTNVRKTSAAGWNAGFESSDLLPANTFGYVEWTADKNDWLSAADNWVLCGFSPSAAATSSHYNTIKYAWYTGILVSSPSELFVEETGTSKNGALSYSTGDTLRIERAVDGTVTYYQNGVLKYTSLITDTSEMKIDGAMYGANDYVKDIFLERGNGPFNPAYANKVNTAEN